MEIGFFALLVTSLLCCCALIVEARRIAQRRQIAPPFALPAEPPLVSLLIPARNEERNIARCLRGALAQRYPNLEVIVVDDGSTDRTAAIVAEFLADPRLRLLSGRPLPPGWIGKCNACQQLAETARGEWLLFLDADTAPQPDLVVGLLRHARAYRLDLLTIFPFLELGTFWERVIMPAFINLISAIFPFEAMEHPDARPDQMIANGQCILVRREAYFASGGHETVRDQILEDVMLAQAVRRSGFRVGAAYAADLLRVRMYTNGAEVVAGLTKNASSGFRSGGVRSAFGGAWQMSITIAPLWIAAFGLFGFVVWPGAASPIALLLGLLPLLLAVYTWAGETIALYRLPWIYGVLRPLGVLAYMAIAMRGFWLVRSGRGVVWKGRTYEG